MVSPEKLPSNQFGHFYKGGNRIGALRHGPGGPMRPEEWIGSVTTRFGEKEQGLSRLSSGELLVEAIAHNSNAWLGSKHFDAFGTSTEILVKLLDPEQRLPVHFHPNKKFSKTHLSLNHGKTEAWIILEAPHGAGVGLGFAEEMNKQQVATMVRNRDSPGLLASLARIEVRTGDTILVPAGTPHAIDSGIFILELQEPTDLSALLEWNDFAVDGTKDGHLGLGFDLVLDALHLKPIHKELIPQLILNARFTESPRQTLFTSEADPYFRAEYINGIGDPIEAGFSIFLVLEGQGIINFESAQSFDVSKGDAIIIPWCAGSWNVVSAQGIACRPPLPQDAMRAR